MDHLEGGELFDKIIERFEADKPLKEKETAIILQQVLTALNYCHMNNIVHRDLKPENIMFANKSNLAIKVIDWGTSRQFNPKFRMKRLIGTPYYIAPEVLDEQYDEKCDLWSIGVICYIILCGCPPFAGDNDQEIMDNIQCSELNFENQDIWEFRSEAAKNFISCLLEKDPLKRLSAQQALQHPWIKNHAKGAKKPNKKLIKKALTNLKTFQSDNKLQQATWVYLVSLLSKSQDKERLSQVFTEIDKNKDGFLTKEEVVDGWNIAFEQLISSEEIEKIFENIDTNKNGKIDYSEFVMACLDRKQLLNKENMTEVFAQFDKDGSGQVDSKEIKAIFDMQSKDQETSDKLWQQLLSDADFSGDGKIDLKEFIKFMNQMAL